MTSITYPPARIQVFRPSIGEEEIEAVNEVLRSGWIGAGPKVVEFESKWAEHIGTTPEHVVSVGCATEGLYQIMWQLAGSDALDEWNKVIIPDNSFIGTAAAILESGMSVKPCDIHRERLNPYWSNYIDALMTDYNNSLMTNVAGIVYQHYGGFDSGWDAITKVYEHWEASLIEDMACHPMGKPVGDFAVWSFDAMKVLTCGDGGMVYCRDIESATRIRQATRLGMDTASGQSSIADKWWEFTATTPGRRSMMNDIGAAIGLVQLKRLPEMVSRRKAIWDAYQSALPYANWLVKPPEPQGIASYYCYWVQLPEDGIRDALAVNLRQMGIYTTYRYRSVSRAYNWSEVKCPNSSWAEDHTLLLPLHPGLSDDDVAYIIDCVREFGNV